MLVYDYLSAASSIVVSLNFLVGGANLKENEGRCFNDKYMQILEPSKKLTDNIQKLLYNK